MIRTVDLYNYQIIQDKQRAKTDSTDALESIELVFLSGPKIRHFLPAVDYTNFASHFVG